MSNIDGNPLISLHGVASRFGKAGGCDPVRARSIATPPWSIQKAVHRLAACQFDPDKPLTMKKLLRLFGPAGISYTGAQLTAARRFMRAIEGDVAALGYLTRVTDALDKE